MMKPESLDALIIDRSLGELPEEVGELLDAYLSGNPEAAAKAGLLHSAIRVTDDVVQYRADLFREVGESQGKKVFEFPSFSGMRIIVAASICLAGLAGFYLKSEQPNKTPNPALLATSRESPWAKYHLEDSVPDAGPILSVKVKVER